MGRLEETSPGRYIMKDLYLFAYRRDILQRKLEELPIKIPLKTMRPETILRRALSLNLDQKNYAFEESSVEKVNDKPVYLILSREALRQEEVDPIVGKAYTGGGSIHVDTSYPDIQRSLEQGFKYHRETAITRDLSIVVTKYLDACMGIPVRPKNGEIYFVLERSMPEVLELMKMVDSLGQESTIRVSPVVGEEVQKVVERAHDHFRGAVDELERLTQEISEETHTRTLHTRLKNARDLMDQVRAYELGLGMELEGVRKGIQAAQERISVRMLSKKETTKEPEPANASDTPQTSQAQLGLS